MLNRSRKGNRSVQHTREGRAACTVIGLLWKQPTKPNCWRMSVRRRWPRVISRLDVTWVITGVLSNDYNGVRWARLPPATANDLITSTIDRFRAHDVPALWQIDAASQPVDLAQRLEALGCKRLDPDVCMVADLRTIPQRVPHTRGLTIERVADERSLSDWMDV